MQYVRCSVIPCYWSGFNTLESCKSETLPQDPETQAAAAEDLRVGNFESLPVLSRA